MGKFEELLGNESSPWREYHLEMASDSLKEYSREDWCDLETTVLSFSACVQERCAEAVGATGSDDAAGTLTMLLAFSSYLDVAAIAASQLDDMKVELPLSLQGRLQQLLDHLTTYHSTRAEDVQRLILHLK